VLYLLTHYFAGRGVPRDQGLHNFSIFTPREPFTSSRSPDTLKLSRNSAASCGVAKKFWRVRAGAPGHGRFPQSVPHHRHADDPIDLPGLGGKALPRDASSGEAVPSSRISPAARMRRRNSASLPAIPSWPAARGTRVVAVVDECRPFENRNSSPRIAGARNEKKHALRLRRAMSHTLAAGQRPAPSALAIA